MNLRHIGIPLAYLPVRHACGHYEARFTRWNGDTEAFGRDGRILC